MRPKADSEEGWVQPWPQSFACPSCLWQTPSLPGSLSARGRDQLWAHSGAARNRLQ